VRERERERARVRFVKSIGSFDNSLDFVLFFSYLY
jgi:hypothetical protein